MAYWSISYLEDTPLSDRRARRAASCLRRWGYKTTKAQCVGLRPTEVAANLVDDKAEQERLYYLICHAARTPEQHARVPWDELVRLLNAVPYHTAMWAIKRFVEEHRNP